MTRDVGAQHEATALLYLQNAGLSLLQRNYGCRLGEIDLIFRDGNTLVFVEVRYRKSSIHGDATATIGINKQVKLIRAAKFYLQRNPKYANLPCRFDTVAISGQPPQMEIDWQQAAFNAY